MPLTRAQAENFVQEFFRDHRLPAPAVRTRKRFLVTTAPRKRLNLPRVITREALADQVAAQLCRACVKRGNTYFDKPRKRPRIARHFGSWRKYVRAIVLQHFGKGDGLR